MPYGYKVDKRGNRHFARTLGRVVAVPKGAVTVEPAKPATVAKVDVDSGEKVVAVEPVEVETAAVAVPTTAKPTTRKKKSS